MTIKMIVLSGFALASLSVSAVEVKSAKLDATGENLLVTVVHGGGCGDHDYKLELKGCAESMPVQCQATIKHTTNDFCEALISREAKFNLKALGLTTEYYKDASLTIKGDQNSSATVRLIKPAKIVATESVRCMTHTGSILEIDNEVVTLTTTANEVNEYNVVGKRVIVLESFPSILQTTYKLDDGRSIVTSFRDGTKSGNGQFIRVDGTRSPEFTCVTK